MRVWYARKHHTGGAWVISSVADSQIKQIIWRTAQWWVVDACG
jgi:hypothetical protein